MKFLIASIFTLALASWNIECSVVPLGHPGIALVTSAAHSHVVGHAPASVAVHASAVGAPWGVSPWAVASPWAHAAAAPWGVSPWGHGVVAAAPHAVVAAAPHHSVVVAGHAHEGSYVAQTRGAVHSAPLAGHASSAAAINVAPAPGTV